jgi:hypothetical protein
MLLKDAMIAAIVLGAAGLGAFLIRDFKNGIIYSHLGIYRRDEQPRAFWFWTTNYFGFLALVISAAIGALLFLPS